MMKKHRLLDNSIHYNADNCRYEVTWPWKEEGPELPDNYELALGWFNSHIRRRMNHPEKSRKYNIIIQDQIKRGMVEKVLEEDPDTAKHYIPHHKVSTPDKTTTKPR